MFVHEEEVIGAVAALAVKKETETLEQVLDRVLEQELVLVLESALQDIVKDMELVILKQVLLKTMERLVIIKAMELLQ